ncbi:hypothetical protein Nmel_000280 [Mimus melanotis]
MGAANPPRRPAPLRPARGEGAAAADTKEASGTAWTGTGGGRGGRQLVLGPQRLAGFRRGCGTWQGGAPACRGARGTPARRARGGRDWQQRHRRRRENGR